jgi:hypothetical protein
MQASQPHYHPNIHLYELANTKGNKPAKQLLISPKLPKIKENY